MEESGASSATSIAYLSKDPTWKYFTMVAPNNKNDLKCNFCNNIYRGGVYRAKQHLVGEFKNAYACTKCPADIRQEIKAFMQKKTAASNFNEAQMGRATEKTEAIEFADLLCTTLERIDSLHRRVDVK